jgi:hypothetical protein
MPRKHKNARSRLRGRMSFKSMCRAIGIEPLERIQLVRQLKFELRERGEQKNI